MTIRKYNYPANDLIPQPFSAMLERIMAEGGHPKNKFTSHTPQVDIAETDKHFEFEVALPGLKKEDIQIDFQEGRLTIAGERKFSDEMKDKNYHTLETRYGTFSRSFMLPDNVAPDAIEASFENGLLQIVVPKDEKKVMKHQLAIN